MRGWPLILMGLLACSGAEVADGPTPRGIDCDERFPPLSWDNYGQGALDMNCAGCHSSLLRPEQRNNAPVGVDFDTYDGMMQWVDRVLIRTVDDRTMPPGGGLSDADVAMMEEWLMCDLGARGDAS